MAAATRASRAALFRRRSPLSVGWSDGGPTTAAQLGPPAPLVIPPRRGWLARPGVDAAVRRGWSSGGSTSRWPGSAGRRCRAGRPPAPAAPRDRTRRGTASRRPASARMLPSSSTPTRRRARLEPADRRARESDHVGEVALAQVCLAPRAGGRTRAASNDAGCRSPLMSRRPSPDRAATSAARADRRRTVGTRAAAIPSAPTSDEHGASYPSSTAARASPPSAIPAATHTLLRRAEQSESREQLAAAHTLLR